MAGNKLAPVARKLPVSLKESPKLKIASNGRGVGFEITFSGKPNVKEMRIRMILNFMVFQ